MPAGTSAAHDAHGLRVALCSLAFGRPFADRGSGASLLPCSSCAKMAASSASSASSPSSSPACSPSSPSSPPSVIPSAARKDASSSRTALTSASSSNGSTHATCCTASSCAARASRSRPRKRVCPRSSSSSSSSSPSSSEGLELPRSTSASAPARGVCSSVLRCRGLTSCGQRRESLFGLSGGESVVPSACASSTGATQTRRIGGRFRHRTRMCQAGLFARLPP
jgi:hypothetical protein